MYSVLLAIITLSNTYPFTYLRTFVPAYLHSTGPLPVNWSSPSLLALVGLVALAGLVTMVACAIAFPAVLTVLDKKSLDLKVLVQ